MIDGLRKGRRMRGLAGARHLTMGESAFLSGLSQSRVILAFDSGALAGFKVPGSRHRRVTPEQLRAFLVAHSIPPDLLDEACPAASPASPPGPGA